MARSARSGCRRRLEGEAPSWTMITTAGSTSCLSTAITGPAIFPPARSARRRPYTTITTTGPLRMSPNRPVWPGASTVWAWPPTVYEGESCHLYHSEGNGRFPDVTQRAGLINRESKALGVCICDLDGDGWPDIVVANDMEANSVYHNNHNGTFTEIGLRSGM